MKLEQFMFCIDCGHSRNCFKRKKLDCTLVVHEKDVKRVIDSNVEKLKELIFDMKHDGIIGKNVEIKVKERIEEAFSENLVCVFCGGCGKDHKPYRGKAVCDRCMNELSEEEDGD